MVFDGQASSGRASPFFEQAAEAIERSGLEVRVVSGGGTRDAFVTHETRGALMPAPLA